MSQEEPFTGIYAQLEHQCNAESIRQLLRNAKDVSDDAKKDITLGGRKEEVIAHLRRAVSLGHVEHHAVHELLAESEENGHQHVLLLRPESTRDSAFVSRADLVANELFGEEWGPDYFPKFEQPRDGYVWADFRIGLKGKPNDWLGKLYGHESYRRTLGTHTEADEEEGVVREIRRFKYYDVRTVLVARWNHPHFLELRVDNRGLRTTETLNDRRRELWGFLRDAIEPDQFIGYKIDGALKHLVDRRLDPRHQEVYSIGQVELIDPGSGLLKMLPCDAEDFDSEPSRSATLQTARDEGLLPHSVRVKWKNCADSPDTMPDELETVISKTDFGPEISIRKRVSSTVLDYVLNRLCTYSARAS